MARKKITPKEFSEVATGVRLSSHEKLCAERMKVLNENINELRKELHRDRKKEVPETLQGEDYNKYLANLKTITEDAYKTKLDKYTEDYPVESADALKYLFKLVVISC